jgi:hypothetical protein
VLDVVDGKRSVEEVMRQWGADEKGFLDRAAGYRAY